MDLDTLAKIGEFVGGVFVIVTLIYLAHQVRRNTKALRIENYARVLERSHPAIARWPGFVAGEGLSSPSPPASSAASGTPGDR